MSAADSRTGGTSKPPRTQTVSVRLDPKLRYLSEIAARRQRRTISSFIEWSLETALDNLYLTDPKGSTNTIGQMAAHLWDVEPADRFVKLAVHYPDLLNHQEEIVWKLIQENGFLWKGAYDKTTNEWRWVVTPSGLIPGRLREYWAVFNKVARGEAPKSELPTWKKSNFTPELGWDEPPEREDDLE